ncbi:MAG TPA: hypothetical protein VFN03_13530 [Trueperaceae bacterium]|nr:hypothetical protein [Trueperaceae bacterium]
MPSYRSHERVRGATFVGALCALLIASATPASAQGDEAIGELAPGTQVLNCLVDRALPVEPAVAADGGFSFQFQALAGTAVDGRSCTVHRLRNSPGGPPTPVRWLAEGELLVDKARLGRCDDDDSCEWVEVARYFDGGFELSDSTLGYGINADQFTSVTASLVAVTGPDLGAITASVGTEVDGTVQLADESEVEIAFTVRSRLRREDGGRLTLVYELQTTTSALQPGGQLALVWDAIIPSGEGGEGGVTDGSDSPFLGLATRFARDGRVALGPDTYALELPVDALTYDPQARLSVVERSRPDYVLLSVPMPAFLPER